MIEKETVIIEYLVKQCDSDIKNIIQFHEREIVLNIRKKIPFCSGGILVIKIQ